jgi:hypothetical protein
MLHPGMFANPAGMPILVLCIFVCWVHGPLSNRDRRRGREDTEGGKQDLGDNLRSTATQ